MNFPRFKEYLKWIYFHLPMVDIVTDLLLRMTRPQVIKTQEKSLSKWSQQAKWLRSPVDNRPSRVVAVLGQANVGFVAQESFVLKSFRLAGYDPAVLIGASSLIRKAYESQGITNISVFPALTPFPRIGLAERMVEEISSFDDLINLEYKGIRVGKYTASTLMRQYRIGSISFEDPVIREMVTLRLANSLACADGASRFIETHKPGAAIFVDRGYSPNGEFFDACIAKDIPCFTWNAAHKNNVLMLKRYSASNRDVHPSSLSPHSWAKLQEIVWTEDHQRVLEHELAYCYSSGEWYGEVGTQVNKKDLETAELKAKLQLNPEKETAVIFSHIFWDATFFWGKDLFKDYEEWFVETIKQACKNDRLNWLIKVHPANVVKNTRDGFVGLPSEIRAIEGRIGSLPPHVRVIPADWDVSTLSLLKLLKYCLTVRGTVGIEAALLGKRVLTAGTGRYDRLGFTTDFESSSDYLQCLQHLDSLPLPSDYEAELARRYAYGVFLGRPLLLQSMTMQYGQDLTASLETRWNVNSFLDLSVAKDLKAARDWILSDDEDFLSLGTIPTCSECNIKAIGN